MEDLAEKVNEKFLMIILESQDPTRLGILTSAYLDFARATQVMQETELQLENWLIEDECCQF